MVCCEVCDPWYHIECEELAHTIAHNTVNCNINCFLDINSGDLVIALLNNFAVLSKDEIRSFTLLKFPLNDFEKTNPKDSHL